ncbi:helix-turn-helix transcriptional regulator [Bacillaceae bacterium]
MKREWLADLRKKAKMTHQSVAKAVGISRQYYGFIENGDRDPSVTVAKKLGNLLGFDWTIFYEDESYETLRKTNTA